MNLFDLYIIKLFAWAANRSPLFDNAVGVLVHTDLLKGGVIVALLWAAWFSTRSREVRTLLVVTFLSGALAALTSRALALLLPYRERPLVVFGSVPEGAWAGWSSFPSDHAAMHSALATGLYLADRRLGTVALWYALILIFVPRIYVGVHYPTDIIAGALLGGGFVLVLSRNFLRDRITRPVLRFQEQSPAFFYALSFLASFSLATTFTGPRRIASLLWLAWQGQLQ